MERLSQNHDSLDSLVLSIPEVLGSLWVWLHNTSQGGRALLPGWDLNLHKAPCRVADLFDAPAAPPTLLPIAHFVSYAHLGPASLPSPPIPAWAWHLWPQTATHHGLLKLIGLDAAHEEGLAGAQRAHQQLQRALELAAECGRALPGLGALGGQQAAEVGGAMLPPTLTTPPSPAAAPEGSGGEGSRARA